MKKLKLDFEITHYPNSENDICTYNVTFEEKITVQELLQHILTERKDEWGSIILNAIEKPHSPKNQLVEYKKGKTRNLNQDLFDKYGDEVIKKIKASGGWTLMNYIVFTEDKELILMREKAEKLEDELNYANEKIRGWMDIVEEQKQEIQTLRNKTKALCERKWYHLLFNKHSNIDDE